MYLEVNRFFKEGEKEVGGYRGVRGSPRRPLYGLGNQIEQV